MIPIILSFTFIMWYYKRHIVHIPSRYIWVCTWYIYIARVYTGGVPKPRAARDILYTRMCSLDIRVFFLFFLRTCMHLCDNNNVADRDVCKCIYINSSSKVSYQNHCRKKKIKRLREIPYWASARLFLLLLEKLISSSKKYIKRIFLCRKIIEKSLPFHLI